jgi:hypothetical protein
VLDGSGRQEIQGVAKLPDARAVAVGTSSETPAVWTFDGSSWSREDVSTERGTLYDVAVPGRGTIVAVGSMRVDQGDTDAVVWTRSRGGQWQSVCDDCGGPGRQLAWAVIARRNGSFVAVGYEKADENYDAAVWLSPDGESWARAAKGDRDLEGENSQVMMDVVAIGDRLVAVGRDGTNAAVWTSSMRGNDWTRVEDSALTAQTSWLQMNAVTKLGTRLVAVGREQRSRQGPLAAAAWVSFDRGSTWRRGRGDFAPRGQQMLDVAPAPPELIAVGYDNARGHAAAAWRSSVGETWTAVRSGAFTSENNVEMNSIALLDYGTLLGVGDEGDDAAIWESQAPR